MKRILRILTFNLFCLSFLAAVFEVDISDFDHTFFDTCDYYVASSGLEVRDVGDFEVIKIKTFDHCFVFTFNAMHNWIQPVADNFLVPLTRPGNKTKLFILHRVILT